MSILFNFHIFASQNNKSTKQNIIMAFKKKLNLSNSDLEIISNVLRSQLRKEERNISILSNTLKDPFYAQYKTDVNFRLKFAVEEHRKVFSILTKIDTLRGCDIPF